MAEPETSKPNLDICPHGRIKNNVFIKQYNGRIGKCPCCENQYSAARISNPSDLCDMCFLSKVKS